MSDAIGVSSKGVRTLQLLLLRYFTRPSDHGVAGLIRDARGKERARSTSYVYTVCVQPLELLVAVPASWRTAATKAVRQRGRRQSRIVLTRKKERRDEAATIWASGTGDRRVATLFHEGEPRATQPRTHFELHKFMQINSTRARHASHKIIMHVCVRVFVFVCRRLSVCLSVVDITY